MTAYSGNELVLSLGATEIGQCRSIGKIGATIQQIDASVYGSEWTDTLGGLKDGAEVAVVIAHDPADAGQTALEAAWDGVAHTFTLEHPDAAYNKDFTALVLSVLTGGERDGLLEMEATLKIVSPGVEEGS
jgi:hypothetical protein